MNWRGYNLSWTWQITFGGVEEWIGRLCVLVCVCVGVWSGTGPLKWYAASWFCKVGADLNYCLFVMCWCVKYDCSLVLRSQIPTGPYTVRTCARAYVCVSIVCTAVPVCFGFHTDAYHLFSPIVCGSFSNHCVHSFCFADVSFNTGVLNYKTTRSHLAETGSFQCQCEQCWPERNITTKARSKE